MAKATLLRFDGEHTLLSEAGVRRMNETLTILDKVAKVEEDDDAKHAATHLRKVIAKYKGDNAPA